MLAKGPDDKLGDKAKAPVHAAAENPTPPAAPTSGTVRVVVLDPQAQAVGGRQGPIQHLDR